MTLILSIFSWYPLENIEILGSSTYFQLVANGKHSNTRIFRLKQKKGIIEGDDNLKKYITNYYKGPFRALERNYFSMMEYFRDDIPQVSETDNEILASAFTEKHIKKEYFKWNTTKPRGLIVSQLSFTKPFGVVKGYLMDLFTDFHKGNLPFFASIFI